MKLRIGILGCANVARKSAIPALKNLPNIELVGIASRDLLKANQWVKEFGINNAYSYDDLVESDEIDAIYVPLPIGLHEKWVIKAAENGKHVICEKSISDNFNSVKKIVEVCKTNEVVLFENFMCDYHTQHVKVKELISEIGETSVFNGFFGFPPLDKKNFRYDSELGGGSLNDAGAYTVFMVRKFFGEPLTATCSLVLDGGVDIKGSAMLDFKDGKIGLLSFGFNNVYQNNYIIWGSKGLIKVNRAYSIPGNLKPDIDLLKNDGVKESVSKVDVSAVNQFELIFTDFCDTIFDKKKVDYDRIINQARVLEAMRISAKENRKVLISEIK